MQSVQANQEKTRSKKKYSRFNKIFIIVFLTFILSFFYMVKMNNVYAEGGGSNDLSIGTIFDSAQKFIQQGRSANGGLDPAQIGSEFGRTLKPIINMLLGIGIISAIAGAMVIGVKYMLAASSGDSKKMAELKSIFFGFALAVVILGGAYPIFSLIVKFLSEMFGYN